MFYLAMQKKKIRVWLKGSELKKQFPVEKKW